MPGSLPGSVVRPCTIAVVGGLFPGWWTPTSDGGFSHRDNAQVAPQVTIAWQGGEPTLIGLDLFRGAVELVHQYARPGMSVEFTGQTSGTLLNNE